MHRVFCALSRSPRKLLSATIPRGSLVGDIGCGSMWKSYLYLYLSNPSLRITGVEWASNATIYGINEIAACARQTGAFTLLAGDIERCPFPFADASLDGVFLSHVIEHLADRRSAIREAARVLRRGGCIYVETPGPGSTLIPKGSFLFRYGDPYPLNYADDPTHLEAPSTIRALEEMLDEEGFSVLRSGAHSEFGRLAAPLYAVCILAGLLPLPHRVRNRLFGFGWWNLVGWPIYAFARRR